MLHLKVDKQNLDSYPTITEALQAVPYNEEAVIEIGEGVFREKLFSDKKAITLIGQGSSKTVILNSDYGYKPHLNGLKLGTFRSFTAFFSGENLTLSNLSIINDSGYGKQIGQAISLYLDVKKAYITECVIEGYQDTLFLAPLPEKEVLKNGFIGPRRDTKREMSLSYFENSTISGNVDFIFGGGDALFKNCKIISRLDEGYVTAPCKSANNIGFVFYKCQFKAEDDTISCVYLMRSWREGAKASFIECEYGKHINTEGCLKWQEIGQNTIGEANCSYKSINSLQLTNKEVETLLEFFSQKFGKVQI